MDKLLKEDCEKNGDYCDFNRRFLDVLNRIPSVSNYNEWSLKKHGLILQNVPVKSIKNALWEIIDYSLDKFPKTPAEFLTKFEDYDFTEFFRDDLEIIDDAEAPNDDKDDDDYLDIDAKLSILERLYTLLKDYSEKSKGTDSENDEEHHIDYQISS